MAQDRHANSNSNDEFDQPEIFDRSGMAKLFVFILSKSIHIQQFSSSNCSSFPGLLLKIKLVSMVSPSLLRLVNKTLCVIPVVVFLKVPAVQP